MWRIYLFAVLVAGIESQGSFAENRRWQQEQHGVSVKHRRHASRDSRHKGPGGEGGTGSEPDEFSELQELPTFVGHVENKTVRAGNSVILTCQVRNLGNYKVAWVRVDTQTILTIHHHIITRNQRVSLSHHDREIWRLHLDNISQEDRGRYMCQVNTDPMRSQQGFLEVVVPPTIVDSRSSSDVVVREGSPVNLTCEATGSPRPELRWRRADGEMIRYKGGMVVSVEGNSLMIPNAGRVHIGTYYCIASNGVPPTKSKSIRLRVQFAPMVWVENQHELAPVGYNITISCNTESYPPAIHFWTFANGTAISSVGKKYHVREEASKMETHLVLGIRNLTPKDFGTYRCVAKNSLGRQDGEIKLSERKLPSTSAPPAPRNTPEIRRTPPPARKSPTSGATYDPFLPGGNDWRTERRNNRKRKRQRGRFEQSMQTFNEESDDGETNSTSSLAIGYLPSLQLLLILLSRWSLVGNAT